MKKLTKKAISIGIIAGLLVLLDGIIVQLLPVSGSFVWVSFISWTVFFGCNVNERIRAVPGYIIGFLLAVAIINLGNILNTIMSLTILGVALSSILATTIINIICIYFEKLKKIYLDSINGIFVGLAMTFSSLGIGLSPNNMYNSLLMLLIIVVYGILGLLCGYLTIKINKD